MCTWMNGRLYVECTLLWKILVYVTAVDHSAMPKISNTWSLLFIATMYLVNPALGEYEVQSGYFGCACSFND